MESAGWSNAISDSRYFGSSYRVVRRSYLSSDSDENSISKEAALSITIQYAQQDKTLSSLKPWEKVQTYYLINDPNKPVWCIRIWKNMNAYNVIIDAYTGEVQEVSKMDL